MQDDFLYPRLEDVNAIILARRLLRIRGNLPRARLIRRPLRRRWRGRRHIRRCLLGRSRLCLTRLLCCRRLLIAARLRCCATRLHYRRRCTLSCVWRLLLIRQWRNHSTLHTPTRGRLLARLARRIRLAHSAERKDKHGPTNEQGPQLCFAIVGEAHSIPFLQKHEAAEDPSAATASL